MMKIPQSIQNISPQTYKLADECARLLWTGINFSNGRSQTSDAKLLDIFGRPFQNCVANKRVIKFSLKQYKILVKTTNLNRYQKVESSELKNIWFCIVNSLSPMYKSNSHMGKGMRKSEQSAIYNLELGAAIAKILGQGNKTTTASRILFFLIPDRNLFNLNEKLAAKLNLPKGSKNFNYPLCREIQKVLIRDWSILKNFTMPMRTSEVHEEIWELAAKGGWWQRRVLDIAILLHFNIASANYAKRIYSLRNIPKKPI